MAVTSIAEAGGRPERIPTEHPHIERVPGVCGGDPKIVGTRIPVWIIAGWHNDGSSVPQILEMYPQLTPAQVHDAISYYYDHRAEIDQAAYENSAEHWEPLLASK